MCDNNFDNGNYASTTSESDPWINLKLPEVGVIACLLLINRNDAPTRLAGTSITIGTRVRPTANPVCISGIDKDGLYVCPNPMRGDNVGLFRTGMTDFYYITELRAYRWVPIDENSAFFSSLVPDNSPFPSLHLLSASTGLQANTLLTVTPDENNKIRWKLKLR